MNFYLRKTKFGIFLYISGNSQFDKFIKGNEMANRIDEFHGRSDAVKDELLREIEKAEKDQIIDKERAGVYKAAIKRDISLQEANIRLNEFEQYKLAKTIEYAKDFKEAASNELEAIRRNKPQSEVAKLRAKIIDRVKRAEKDGVIDSRESEISQDRVNRKISAEVAKEMFSENAASHSKKHNDFQKKLNMDGYSFKLANNTQKQSEAHDTEKNSVSKPSKEDLAPDLELLKKLSEETQKQDNENHAKSAEENNTGDNIHQVKENKAPDFDLSESDMKDLQRESMKADIDDRFKSGNESEDEPKPPSSDNGGHSNKPSFW
jgi:DNA-binding Lrp family transcriptional regulator